MTYGFGGGGCFKRHPSDAGHLPRSLGKVACHERAERQGGVKMSELQRNW